MVNVKFSLSLPKRRKLKFPQGKIKTLQKNLREHPKPCQVPNKAAPNTKS